MANARSLGRSWGLPLMEANSGGSWAPFSWHEVFKLRCGPQRRLLQRRPVSPPLSCSAYPDSHHPTGISHSDRRVP